MRKSTILLVIPKIEKFSRSRELGVEQTISWSRIADCGGCDNGWPVTTKKEPIVFLLVRIHINLIEGNIRDNTATSSSPIVSDCGPKNGNEK